MARMSEIRIELEILHEQAETLAEALAAKLDEISRLYWGQCEDCPLFRLDPDTRDMLRSIETMMAVPISEIEATA